MPASSQFGCLVTVAVTRTVSVCVCEGSRLQTWEAVSWLLSLFQVYCVLFQSCPSASIVCCDVIVSQQTEQ